MYHSIYFEPEKTGRPNGIGDNTNTYDDWHIVTGSRPLVNPPKVQTNHITIPGSNSELDLTETLTGSPIYSSREGSWSFYVLNGYWEWQVVYSRLMAYFHGKRMKVILEDDQNYYYEGRLSVNSWASDPSYSKIAINYHVGPFKMERYIDDWLWDPFNFSDDNSDIVREYSDLQVEGTRLLIIPGREMQVVPKFTVKAGATLEQKAAAEGTSTSGSTQETTPASTPTLTYDAAAREDYLKSLAASLIRWGTASDSYFVSVNTANAWDTIKKQLMGTVALSHNGPNRKHVCGSETRNWCECTAEEAEHVYELYSSYKNNNDPWYTEFSKTYSSIWKDITCWWGTPYSRGNGTSTYWWDRHALIGSLTNDTSSSSGSVTQNASTMTYTSGMNLTYFGTSGTTQMQIERIIANDPSYYANVTYNGVLVRAKELKAGDAANSSALDWLAKRYNNGEFSGTTVLLQANSSTTVPSIVIGEGEHYLLFSGYGTVSVDYRGGLL